MFLQPSKAVKAEV